MTVEYYMKMALDEARLARDLKEIPVGAIIVRDYEIIAQAHNKKEALKDATAHAEIIAIKKASQYLSDWRLSGCTLYVTLEPCCMCTAALASARINRIVFGAFDKLYGGCGSAFELCGGALGHHIDVIGGVWEDECASLLNSHFTSARS